MANPVTDAKNTRASHKRKITSLLKESAILLASGDGIPDSEYRTLADRIREQLRKLEEVNDFIIKTRCKDLKPEDYDTDEKLEKAAQDVADKEEAYLHEILDKTLPVIDTLVKAATKAKVKDVTTKPTSGDIRDYGRFKELFKHFSKHLNETECLYQLVESMEMQTEKNKIKACIKLNKAWEILDEAYGDQHRLIEALFGDLEQMTSYGITKGNADLKAMERFVEQLQNFTRQIESIGMSSDLNGRMMLSQVRRKLPEEHRIQFLQNVGEDKATDSVPRLVKWLHSLLMLLQKAKIPNEQQQQHMSSGKSSVSQRSVSHSTMSPGPGGENGKDNENNRKREQQEREQMSPKCPLHPRDTSHFIKGCRKFRTLSQAEKFDIMNANSIICHRCGHNNCVAGKRPFNHDECQFVANCQIPTCGMNTHFTSICPRVYGVEGYRHYDCKLVTPMSSGNAGLNADAKEFQIPVQKSPSPMTRQADCNVGVKDRIGIICALPTVMGYLRHNGKKTLVRILLDTGSQISLVREGIVKSQESQMQDFRLTTVGGDTITRKLRVLECTLESLDGSFSRVVHLTEMMKPCGDAPIVTNKQIRQYPHLADVSIVEAPDKVIDILLGVENGDLLTSTERVLGSNIDDPTAVKCPFGWYVQGGLCSHDVLTNAAVNYIDVSAISEFEDFLGIERMGIEPKRCKCTVEEQDKAATQSMRESVTQLVDGNYQISLPWRKSPQVLPNNYDYAVKRLLSLEKQFKEKPAEWKTYCRQMEDQVKRGVARVVPAAEMEDDIRENRKMWFLPHFGVLKDSATTPVRVVYDGKARYQGHSLNDYLAKGDNLNSNLFEVALRFREYEVGVIADISKMFQAVKVTPGDARFHRYVFRESPEDPIQVFELTTVTFGDRPSPTAATIALRHVAADNAPNDEEIGRVINNQFYVDDLSESVRSVERS